MFLLHITDIELRGLFEAIVHVKDLRLYYRGLWML